MAPEGGIKMIGYLSLAVIVTVAGGVKIKLIYAGLHPSQLCWAELTMKIFPQQHREYVFIIKASLL